MFSLRRGFFNLSNLLKLYIFFVPFLCGCLQKDVNTGIYLIRPPEWVTNVNDDDFYVVGVTDRNVSLMTAFSCAKKNAIDNLKVNIFVKLEDVFTSETQNISVDKKADLWFKLDEKIWGSVTSLYLNSIIRFDDVWRSPDSEILYVGFSADRVSIVSKVIDLLDEIKEKYKNNSELKQIIENIKNNIIDSGFRTKIDIKNMNSKRENILVNDCGCEEDIRNLKNNISISNGSDKFYSKLHKIIDDRNSEIQKNDR